MNFLNFKLYVHDYRLKGCCLWFSEFAEGDCIVVFADPCKVIALCFRAMGYSSHVRWLHCVSELWGTAAAVVLWCSRAVGRCLQIQQGVWLAACLYLCFDCLCAAPPPPFSLSLFRSVCVCVCVCVCVSECACACAHVCVCVLQSVCICVSKVSV